jgi:hypothetical protein
MAQLKWKLRSLATKIKVLELLLIMELLTHVPRVLEANLI